jgi:putative transposase
MQLVEQHVIRKADTRYAAIDQAAFASKNLYNAANYLVRQAFIHEGVYLLISAPGTKASNRIVGSRRG